MLLVLIISIHVLITPYPYACIHDVYNAATRLHHILILLSFSVYTYVYTLAPYIPYVCTTRSSSLCMCIYTYLLSLVYYTVHAPYHHCGYSAASYTSPCALPSIHLFPTHISTSITCHLTCHHLISSSLIHIVSAPPVSVTWHAMPLHAPYHHMVDTLPPLTHLHVRSHSPIHRISPYPHILRSIESMESMESMIWTI